MEKTQSLAEFLGTFDPRKPAGQEGVTQRVAASSKLTAEAFAKGVLDSPEYREHLQRLILLDDLPPALECLLYYYAHGKPVERVEYKDKTDDIDEMNVEQCEDEAMRLLEIARTLRAEGATTGNAIH